MLNFLDKFFLVFHTGLTLFNLLGWLWRKTRLANLITLSLTAFSWGILGIWYGFGYCPCTDWHWQVLWKLGERDLPRSYIVYLLEKFTGFEPATSVVNIWVVALFMVALIMSIILNYRDYRMRISEDINE
ncbi:MAG: DUF2784 domain-containing protein [Candidatus Marinimicrobia bacterium]|nr:DUF2784 domain-containing protein [Candidatus Neomarinimicrobiota bacterium]MCF7827517.1 DUF2784 domain-containing protein [Candidatus Neomarinimicrobiota bacterium]MCF7881621.1 DUF2784 domain-containing protein [Candidatus Neomarinimicrobiota bacterium]